MPEKHDVSCDSEFLKLLTRDSNVDLMRAALEISRDVLTELNFEHVLSWIAERGREIACRIRPGDDEISALQELVHCLAVQQGICGNAEAYNRVESSFPSRVIETGSGIPISLCLLYQAVGEKAGINLEGVAAPHHFLLRCETLVGPVIVDPYHRGRTFTIDECVSWLQQETGMMSSQIRRSLYPASQRTIIIRMLNNLKIQFVENEDWEHAWMMQHRLTALQPASYFERIDLATISLKANHPGQALELFRSCLKSCPPDDAGLLKEQIQEANNKLALWN